MDQNNFVRYDEFNIYQDNPTKVELKQYMDKHNENKTGEELAVLTINEYNLDESYFITLNEILDELDL